MTRADLAERAALLRARHSILLLQTERAPLGSDDLPHYRAAAEAVRRELADLGARALDLILAQEGYRS